MAEESVLEVQNLILELPIKEKFYRILDDVDFVLRKGEILGIVGESGAGKSMTALSIMKLLPNYARLHGKILYKGHNIIDLSEKEMQDIRGNNISMIYQDPMTSLNPVKTIGFQVEEAINQHQKSEIRETNIARTMGKVREKAIDILTRMGIPSAGNRLKDYPFEFSGGMRQRVLIAMGLALNPDILIADEPTTALDVTIQAQILILLKELQKEYNTSILYISHDLAVVAEFCERVIVMYGGKIVEIAEIDELLNNPQHPYTKGLLKSYPNLDLKDTDRIDSIRGEMPEITELPEGCYFNIRCDFAFEPCKKVHPMLKDLGNGHEVSCYLYNGRSEHD